MRRWNELLRSPRLIEELSRSHFALNTTTRCQHRCAYCFMKEHSADLDLSPSDVQAFILRIAKKCDAVLFMGAEPTLNPNIVEHIAFCVENGLQALISTNALRFKSIAFLRRCIDAGLSAIELSFPYPNEDIYSAITGRTKKGYSSLLSALDNINTVNAEVRADSSTKNLLGVNVNLVVSQYNYLNLRDVLNALAQHMPDTDFFVTMRGVNPFSHSSKGMEEFCSRYFVPLLMLKRVFSELLEDWPYSFPVIFRGIPLCATPGHEDLHVSLLYHIAGAESRFVLENVRDQSVVGRCHQWKILCRQDEVMPECLRCNLEKVCLDRFALGFDSSPLNRPVPSNREIGELLASMGIPEYARQDLIENPPPYTDEVPAASEDPAYL